MTASELQDLLIKRLTRTAGGTARRWRIAIGAVHVRKVGTYAHCNWEVRPSGSPRENAEIEHLLDTVRLDHSILRPD